MLLHRICIFILWRTKNIFITIINLIIITIFLYSLLTAAIVDNHVILFALNIKRRSKFKNCIYQNGEVKC